MPDPIVAEKFTKAAYVRIDGQVWCGDCGAVHEDNVNPYGMGPESWCKREEFRPLYFRAKKGDWK